MHHPAAGGSFGDTSVVVSERLCVVYDTASGEIVHTHRVVTLEGGQEPSADEIAADAVSLASDRRGSGDGLDALHASHDALQPGRRYRVEAGRIVSADPT